MKSDSTRSTLLKPRWGFFAFLIVVTCLMRLTPYIRDYIWETGLESSSYLWNFSAIPAICLFGAAIFQNIRWSYLLPLVAWFIGDLGIWVLTGNLEWAFYRSQPFTYLGYISIVSFGLFLRQNKSIAKVSAVGLAGPVSFFLISNFGVWAMGQGILYPKTFDGLITCYAAGLPFFRNSLISMAVFLPILFSPLALTHLQKEPEAKIALETF